MASGLFNDAEFAILESELCERDSAIDGKCPLDAQRLRSFDAVQAYGVWLYALVRKFRPNVVLETGVQNGCSTEMILWALYRNQHGRLDSIDSGPTSSDGSHRTPSHQTVDGEPGRQILAPLKERWNLTIGLSQDCLPTLCGRLQRINLFWHDSDHSEKNVEFEFSAVKPYMVPGGLMAMHDYHGQPTTLANEDYSLVVDQSEPLLRVWRKR